VLITIGVLFLLHEVRGNVFDFSNTYPFILIVIGAILLASAMAPMDGHIDPMTAPPPGAPQAGPPATPVSAQSPLPGQGTLTAHAQPSPSRQQRIQRIGSDLYRLAAAVA